MTCTLCGRAEHRASHCPWRRQRGFVSIAAAIALAAGLCGALAAYKLTSMRYEARIAADAQEARERVNAANRKANQAGADYERLRTARRARQVVIVKELTHALQSHPQWSDAPIPDGVRDRLRAAAASASASEPDRGVPAVSAIDGGSGDKR